MQKNISRRVFAGTLTGSAAALALPAMAIAHPDAFAEQAQPVNGKRLFPPDFLWGSATASYQVEGAVKEDGRGPSIWDTFSHTPGKTHEGDTGDVSDDFYHRFPDDIALMRSLGLKGFRLSISWPRIFPKGTGQPNQQGIDFYSRLVDALLGAGIQPYVTLYHWDLPQALEDKGGWQNRDTAKVFGDYAGFIAGKLAPRVSHFMTTNEIRTFVELGYGKGTFAPGLKLKGKALAQVNHNAVLGHGMAVRAIRAAAPRAQVGLAENPTACSPAFASPEHIEAARKAFREENASYLTVVQEGRYTEAYLKRLGTDAPTFTSEDLQMIGSRLDFTGLNIYQPTYVRADSGEQGYALVPQPASYPTMYSPWLSIGPECLYWATRFASELWHVPALYITENGASAADTLAPDGHVYDTDRTMYLRNYLTQLQRAASEGIPVKGYFLWSLMDNYEWADGYSKRFGITYVDFGTQKRTPKLSAEFYKQVIATNAVA